MALLDVKQIKNSPTKLPVKAVTTAALATNTYSNGTSGAGATLTATGNAAIAAVDGVTLSVGDRLLVKNEATAANNGIYVVTQVGSVSLPYILTRADDCNTNARIFAGIFVQSTSDGTTNKNRGWILTTTGAITVGTTGLTWALDIESSAVVPTTSDKGRAASATTGDGQTSGLTISNTPANSGYVAVLVNGQQQVLGDGVKTKDCYFSVDGGTTARAISAIVSGDTLYWNGITSGWNLATTDIIDFDYDV